MILIKTDLITEFEKTATWAWWSEEDLTRQRFSPLFHSESEAIEWHKAVVESILKERNHEVSIGKQCTCDNCSCNASK